ncbi:MAG: response regulator [Acidobacteriota bacterium]
MALPQQSTRWQRAIDLANRGSLDEARELFSQIAEDDPEDAGVWRWLANVTPEGRSRVEFLERALALNPADDSTRAELYEGLVRQGVGEAQAQQRDVARRSFSRAIEVLPEEEIAFLWLIEVCDHAEERIQALEQLFALQPDDRSIRGALARDLALLGESLAERGEKDEARAQYRRAHELDPTNAQALFFLAEDDLTDLGDRLAMLGELLKHNPKHERAKMLWDALAQRATTESSTLPVNCCSICRAPREPTSMQCPVCGVEHSLFDVSKLLGNEGVVRDRVEPEIERLEDRLEHKDDWRIRKSLLLARLNLGEARPAAREAARLLETIPMTEPQRLEIEQVQLYLIKHYGEDIAAPDAPEEPEEQQHILVVDDSATVRMLVGTALEEGGYETSFAGTGMEALAALRQNVPALVLLDIGLPNMDGYQLCQLIRQNPSTAEVPVIMLSARDGFFDQVRGRMVGCQDYVTKPFDADDLLARVQNLISQDS